MDWQGGISLILMRSHGSKFLIPYTRPHTTPTTRQVAPVPNVHLACLLYLSVMSDTLRRHIACSPPDSSVHGILQGRILEWVAISFFGDLPNPRIKPVPLESPVLADGFCTWEASLCTLSATYSPLDHPQINSLDKDLK